MGYLYQTIELTFKLGICTLTLNRPGQRNALSKLMLTELCEAFESLSEDSDLRLLVVNGNGGTFCAGADLTELLSLKEKIQAHQYAALLAAMLDALESIPVPVVLVAQGAVYGGGLGLLSVADFVIADKDLKLSFSELRLGLVPAVISSYVLKRIGASQTRQLMLSATEFGAVKAEQIGLVWKQSSLEKLEECKDELLAELTKNGPAASRTCKAMLAAVAKAPQLEGVKEYTRNVFSETVLHSEAQLRLAAFSARKRTATGKSKKKNA